MSYRRVSEELRNLATKNQGTTYVSGERQFKKSEMKRLGLKTGKQWKKYLTKMHLSRNTP